MELVTAKWLLWFSALTNVILIAMVTLQTSYITDHIVWDIDKVRSTHLNEVSYWYKKGCVAGTKYPEDLRNIPQNAWNPNNPTVWCDGDSRIYEEDFMRSAWKLGR
jgi:hypothetical protein